MKDQIVVKFDAACHNKANHNCPMGLGVAVFINAEYREDLSRAELLITEEVEGTSNVGEWNALILALKVVIELRKHYDAKISIFGDSQLVVNQFNMIWRINEEKFKPYFNEARALSKLAKIGDAYWIRREENTHADDLSKQGLELFQERYQIKGIHPESESEWIEFTSNNLQEVKRQWWLVEQKDAEYYIVWDNKLGEEIIFNKQ